MKTTPAKNENKCPKCGMEFDPTDYDIVECPECGSPGSTKCCNPGGKNCLCSECEQGPEDE